MSSSDKVEHKFTSLIAGIGGIISFFLLLVTFISDIQRWLENPQMVAVLAWAFYIVFATSSFWVFRWGPYRSTVRWSSLGLLFVVSAAFFYWMGTWKQPTPAATRPSNLSKILSFDEDELGKNLTLQVCDDAQSPWYDHCYIATEKCEIDSSTGEIPNTLKCNLELLPEYPQVYSLGLTLDKPEIVDFLSANIYIDDPEMISVVRISALIKDEWAWKTSEILVSETGWLNVNLDLQQFIDQSGLPASERGITEVHVDIFIPQTAKEVEETYILLKEILFFYPASTVLSTND